MKDLCSENFKQKKDDYILSNKHIRLLDNIFRQYHQLNGISEFQAQILDWAAIVLLEEKKLWEDLRENSIDILCHLDRKNAAYKRAAAKNKRYEPFKKVFKQLQKIQFIKYQKAGKTLSANAFVKWFLKNKIQTIEIRYIESNQTNQLIKLAQANNREFKKLLNAEADTSLTAED